MCVLLFIGFHPAAIVFKTFLLKTEALAKDQVGGLLKGFVEPNIVPVHHDFQIFDQR